MLVKILVTNDDGISSTGLHVLARTMRRHGKVCIYASATTDIVIDTNGYTPTTN